MCKRQARVLPREMGPGTGAASASASPCISLYTPFLAIHPHTLFTLVKNEAAFNVACAAWSRLVFMGCSLAARYRVRGERKYLVYYVTY
jgi:hypothetical protein